MHHGYSRYRARCRRMTRPAILSVMCFLVAACGGRDPVANGANDTAGMRGPAEASPDPTGGAPADAVTWDPDTTAEPASATKIPVAYHGRWGMAPGDCSSTRGDNKGLLTITANEMRFYESVAVPGSTFVVGASDIRGDFNFTGEGQSWTKFQSLRFDGQELIRTESNPTASYSYAKCS